MKSTSSFAGLDFFKIAAALLVIAVHTSPLLSISETGDFVLTRVIARVAVPFFFMATGFFLLPRYFEGNAGWRDGMGRFMARTGRLYLISIILFLPINLYAGHWNEGHFSANLLKDLLFDGTFYHLWYLPASMLGAMMVYGLSRLSQKPSFLLAATGLLYSIGLLGDSYYGLAEVMPPVEAVYDVMFNLFDYTRNGLFFAPIYLALGAVLGGRRSQLGGDPATFGLTDYGRRWKQSDSVVNIAGMAISFTLLLGEALLLHHLALQRHDSMYIMLLPCMYFLFRLLLVWKGTARPVWRTALLLIYIVHPLWIIAVRGLAKLLELERLFVENSLLHFTAVAALSVISSFAIAMLLRPKDKRVFAKNRAWAELDMFNLRHNVAELQRILPRSSRMMAVVKANAYGHGDIIVAKELSRIGVTDFAVATLSEGIRLRRQGVKGMILVLSHTHPEEAAKLKRYKLVQTVGDCEYGGLLNEQGVRIEVHVKIDTGMHRLGICCDNVAQIAELYRLDKLRVTGIYTHLSRADSREEDDVRFTTEQIERYNRTVAELRGLVGSIGKTHIQSSYGVLNYPELQCDYARVGIALYGALSHPDDNTRVKADLRPVLTLKARISAVKLIAAGETIGYGSHSEAAGEMTIAVVSIGYADGIPRSLSCGKGSVLAHGQYALIVGQVCMDQLMIDVTRIPELCIGDVVTVIGQEGSRRITAEQVAAGNDSIANDLLSRLGDRIERVSESL